MGDISKNFNFYEFFTEGADVQSRAVLHTPNIYSRIRDKLVLKILQPMRDEIGLPVKITCGYRSDAFNASLEDASPSSHHLFRGDKAACDVTCANVQSIYDWLLEHRDRFCYAYWNKKKNFIHISALTNADSRVGRMWRIIDSKNEYEPDWRKI